MRVWLINNYNMLPEHGQLNRNYNFAKCLVELGHEPVCFVGSHPHNTSLQLINDKAKYKIFQDKPFKWVLIKTRNYENSKLSRVISMFEFYFNMLTASKYFEKPDAIVGSSAHPLAAYLAIKLGKRFNCKKVVEIRDLWPESIVAYGIASPRNPAILALRRLEKWLYVNADEVIFTMEGGYDYIVDQGWDNEISIDKIHYLTNGVNISEYDDNITKYSFEDKDLDNPNTYKVVYVGSFRKANEQILKLIDAAKLMQDDKHNNVQFLLYGKGDLLNIIKQLCVDNNISNVIIKGSVPKPYIPYILSKCNLNILNLEDHTILRYGGSQNKLFEYLASGHPIITGETGKYSIIKNKNCGYAFEFTEPEDIVAIIDESQKNPISYEHIRSVAMQYDYRLLTNKLIEIVKKD